VPLEDRLLAQFSALRKKLRSVRVPLLVAGAFLFVFGAWWSFGQLRLSIDDIQLPFLALLLLVMMPASLLYSGIGLHIIALSGGVRIPLRQATVTACYAVLAEALPIPGGVIVRSGALMAEGLGLVRSVALVTANSLLWIALAAVGAAIAIIPYSSIGGLSMLAIGGAGLVAVLAWLVWTAGPWIAAYSLAHRAAGIVLLALRLFLAFQAIGVSLPFIKAFPVTLAMVVGAAASITPAGLGISETLGALIASVVQVAPAAAFIAVGLDRLLVLFFSGLSAFAIRGRANSVTNFDHNPKG
jgi:uncharacterized membrane protein YbhN (UPF0104 family)